MRQFGPNRACHGLYQADCPADSQDESRLPPLAWAVLEAARGWCTTGWRVQGIWEDRGNWVFPYGGPPGPARFCLELAERRQQVHLVDLDSQQDVIVVDLRDPRSLPRLEAAVRWLQVPA